jgi:hypothetical protein
MMDFSPSEAINIAAIIDLMPGAIAVGKSKINANNEKKE